MPLQDNTGNLSRISAGILRRGLNYTKAFDNQCTHPQYCWASSKMVPRAPDLACETGLLNAKSQKVTIFYGRLNYFMYMLTSRLHADASRSAPTRQM